MRKVNLVGVVLVKMDQITTLCTFLVFSSTVSCHSGIYPENNGLVVQKQIHTTSLTSITGGADPKFHFVEFYYVVQSDEIYF